MQQIIQANQDALKTELELDLEWVELLLEAKRIGITIEEVALFLKQCS